MYFIKLTCPQIFGLTPLKILAFNSTDAATQMSRFFCPFLSGSPIDKCGTLHCNTSGPTE